MGLGGADVHAPVDPHAVNRDDLGAKASRQRHGDRAFSCGRRSEEGGDRRQIAVPTRWLGEARSMCASKNVPERWDPGTWTTLLVRVRAVIIVGSLRDGPSLSTSTVEPMSAWFFSTEIRC